MIWELPTAALDLSRHGLVMGVLNVTPDSFSDGGRYQHADAAIARARVLIEEGADIIDVGGESSRPGSLPVSVEEELARVIPVIRTIADNVMVSVDTTKAAVAEAALQAGAVIVNDITALRADPQMADIVKKHRAGVVLMHMLGTPATMQSAPVYDDVVREVQDFFRHRLDNCLKQGIPADRIALDPGIGFGKTVEHNLTLLNHLHELGTGHRPLLVGVSRKSFLGKIIHSDHIEDREWPTTAITSFARERGARIFRVHDITPNRQALTMTEAILNS